MMMAIRAGTQAYFSYLWRVLKPQKETRRESSAMMTIPTVALIVVPPLTAESACPPIMESTMEKPVSVARLSRMKSETKYLLDLVSQDHPRYCSEVHIPVYKSRLDELAHAGSWAPCAHVGDGDCRKQREEKDDKGRVSQTETEAQSANHTRRNTVIS
jgi:hypothetical protein